jgi:hypothetical protein
VPETLEASLVLGDSVLTALGTSTDDTATIIEAQRADNYASLALPSKESVGAVAGKQAAQKAGG